MISTRPSTSSLSDRIYAPGSNGTLQLATDISDEHRAPGPAINAIHAALRAFISHDAYPCVGAKAALNKNAYRIAQYGGLGRHASIVECTHDLQWFTSAADQIDPNTASFVAVFDDPDVSSESDFEEKLWSQLQGMHDIDSLNYDWDTSVSSDPSDPDFSFSIATRAFFIIGMYPHAPRESRRFPYPTLVFNLHDQFETLREKGTYESIKATIRDRESMLEGKPNPLLADFGTRSEAQQYAGRAHACPWKPNFTTRNTTITHTEDTE